MVYWERQGADALCAVHCLNSLLQGPHWTAVALSEIAQELDREERRLLQAAGDRCSPTAANVDTSGNFSSQVLFRALQRCGNLRAVDSRHEDVRAAVARSPELEVGYICNLHRHWVAMRKVPWTDGREVWFNLNSRGPAGPVEVGREELTSFLVAASADQDTVFVVRGGVWPRRPGSAALLEAHQMFLDQEDLGRLQAEEQARQACELDLAMGLVSPTAALSAGSALTAGAGGVLGAAGEKLEAPLPECVPDPWTVVWSEAESAYYYWNTATGITQWEHPCARQAAHAKAPVDDAVAQRLFHLAKCGSWEKLLPELACFQQEWRATHGVQRGGGYVDHQPPPSARGLVHYAAEQGKDWAVRRLLSDFGAEPGLRTAEGRTAADLAAAAGHVSLAGMLRSQMAH